MNGGESGISHLDVAALIVASLGCLLIHMARRLWRVT